MKNKIQSNTDANEKPNHTKSWKKQVGQLGFLLPCRHIALTDDHREVGCSFLHFPFIEK